MRIELVDYYVSFMNSELLIYIMAIDKNPIKICWYCKKEFDGDFAIKDLQIICPFCKRPQSSVFEKDSQAQLIKRSKDGIKNSKADLKKSQS